MKIKLISIAICVLAFATITAAQNSIKLFDPIAITVSDYNTMQNSSPFGMFKSTQVYLSCPTAGRPTSSVSGPNGGALIVDNTLTVNDENLCEMGKCFSSLVADPGAYVGMPVEMAYTGIAPINISRQVTTSGLYTFNLLDFGYTFGSSAIYLNTSCTIIPINTPEPDPIPTTTPGDSVVCHRDNGTRGQQTLNVGPSAVAAHLAHGDTLGACSQ